MLYAQNPFHHYSWPGASAERQLHGAPIWWWRKDWQVLGVLADEDSRAHKMVPSCELNIRYFFTRTSLVAQTVKSLPAIQETWVWSLGWKDPLEKEMSIYSSILAWRIPWTEEPGRLWGCRVGHDWETNTFIFTMVKVSGKLQQPNSGKNVICLDPQEWRNDLQMAKEGPFSKGSSLTRDWTWVTHIAGRFFTIWATREAQRRPNSILIFGVVQNLTSQPKVMHIFFSAFVQKLMVLHFEFWTITQFK